MKWGTPLSSRTCQWRARSGGHPDSTSRFLAPAGFCKPTGVFPPLPWAKAALPGSSSIIATSCFPGNILVGEVAPLQQRRADRTQCIPEWRPAG